MIETIQMGKLRCAVGGFSKELFISLVDYRNNLFTSNDDKKIIEFYNSFDDRNQLINWMKERPKGASHIYEVEGDKDIIVVIPTADFEGKYAKGCRENIFKGIHMVFVESGKDDFYFNYAHNCNVGIKKALEYNPKWIVVSNDDMRKIDEPEILRNSLMGLNPGEVDIVFTKESPDNYHSTPTYLGRPNFFGKIYHFVEKLFKRKFFCIPYSKENFTKKYSLNVILLPKHEIIKVFFCRIKPVYATESFMVFSGNYARINMGNILNESFCNGAEDWDLSYRTFHKNINYGFIEYLIGEETGGTNGTGRNRALRDIANISLFNQIHERDFE